MAIQFNNTLGDFHNFAKDQGFYYSLDQIYDFYISLKTKPFVIIAGISGSGKSKIVDLFGDYIGKVNTNYDNFELVSVKPNWTDNQGIFGFSNLMTNTYEITPTVKLFLRAKVNPGKPYFLILDEMNLAKVEYYFSDFLSVLESRRVINIDSNFFQALDAKLDEKYNSHMTLSQAIIISALTLPEEDQFRPISDFRQTAIAEWWKRNYYKGQDKHWTPQFRTELNQNRPANQFDSNGFRKDGSRLASKAFFAMQSGNQYKLKNPEDMDEVTRREFLFISNLISEHKVKQEKINLHSSDSPLKVDPLQKDYSGSLFNGKDYYVPSKLEIPLNVFVIGTVNIDETTYMFSPKVLDRANVLEFNNVDLYSAYGYGNQPSSASGISSSLDKNSPFDMEIELPTLNDAKILLSKYPEVFEIIANIFEILQLKNRHFGYRVINEISRFIVLYMNDQGDNPKNALDIQILQKVLPKLNGTEDQLSDLLKELRNTCENNSLFRSQNKIEKMMDQLETTGYVTFIE